MPTFSQANRPLRVETTLGEDAVLLTEFAGEEGISTPFSYTLQLLSEDASIDGKKLLRSPATVTLELPGGSTRRIHGMIRRFVQLGQSETKLVGYRAEIVPWLWFLSLSSGSRIFQNMSVLDIVEEVFKASKVQGSADFQIKCTKSYPKREFCVQYRETHFNFVSRLLEDEGIFYFFEHTKDKHVLVLADSNSTVKPCPDQATARMATQAGEWQEQDVVTELAREDAVHTGKITLRDYDYLQPALQLESSMSGDGKAEAYDYPGNYTKPDEGDRYARLRLEEQEAWLQVSRGASTCRAFQSGYRFDLKKHYRADANQTYTLASVHHSARMGGFHSGEAEAFEYHNTFLALPHRVPFRPPRASRRPVIRGSQTALVVGKSGEEIWTDKHGRVKVQFHWDREGKKNEDSSCWVRVGSVWAGKGWGFIQIPRIGQEVIVDFLEGDPDHPIITGRVYNAEQTPPYSLPGDQTQSGVKSRSSKGGTGENFNEIRLEDKKGSEQIVIHAEKDMQVEVENDETRQVDHDRTTTIKNNDTRTVSEGDDAHTVEKGKQTVLIEKGDQEVTLNQGSQKVTLRQGDQSVTLTQGNQNVTLDQGNQEIALKMGNRTIKLDLGNVSTKASVGKISEEAMQGIELVVGQSSVKIDQAGVTIKGLNVTIQGQIQAEVKGTMTNIKGDGVLMVKGGITMIN